MATHSDAERERILAKIKKCLSLSGSSNPHEAETALRQARKLMESLGVTMDDVESSCVGEAFRRTGNGRKRHAPSWVGLLANLIAESFSCTPLLRCGMDGNGVMFVGIEPSPELAGYAFDVMYRQLAAARKKYLDENPPARRGVSRARRRNEGVLFMKGWLYAVSQMISDFSGMDEETARAVNAYMDKNHPGTPSAKPSRKKARALSTRAELNAIQEGFASGSKAQLHKAAGVGASALLLPGTEQSHQANQAAQASLF